MRNQRRIGRTALLLLVLSFAPITVLPQNVPIDQVPMYGGVDRSTVPELKEGDDKFISEVTAKFGSRQKASAVWVEQGFRFYQQDKLDMAMRRFNQAWLLDPANPEVYSGFASVLSDQRKYCEAQAVLEVGFSKGPIQDGFLPDAALLYTLCAVGNSNMEATKKQVLFQKADELLSRAYASPAVRKPYTLAQWAKALFFRGDYSGTWGKIAEFRQLTGQDADPNFLRELRAKMPEPGR